MAAKIWQTFEKDPNEKLDYGFDWYSDELERPWLADDEQIESSEWIVPDGLTVEDESFSIRVTTVWLSGGTLAETGETPTTYTVTNRITTNLGRIADRSFAIIIRER